MNSPVVILIMVFAVLACGCTTSTSPGTAPATPAATAAAAVQPAAPALPDLTGTWTGTAVGYDEDVGFSTYKNGTITMVVTEQHGRIFSGHFVFTSITNRSAPVPMAGAFGSDGRTFQIVEKNNGYTTGVILPDNTIELMYSNSDTPYSIAIDTLKRV